MGRMEGKVGVVTGAASGIGAATAARLADDGATVVGWDLDGADVGLDVRDEDAIAAAVADVVARHGRLDAVVHAAGVAGGGPAHLVPAEEWDRVVDINLKGTFLVGKHAVAAMLAQDPVDGERGAIVNIASVEGLAGTEGGSTYNAAKGGVVILTKNMAIDYGRAGIRVERDLPGVHRDADARGRVRHGRDGRRARRHHRRPQARPARPGRRDRGRGRCSSARPTRRSSSGVALPVDGGYTAGHRHGVSALMGLD